MVRSRIHDHSEGCREQATQTPMWGYPVFVLGAVCSFLEPFRGHLSPNVDNVSEKLTLRYPHKGPWVVRTGSFSAVCGNGRVIPGYPGVVVPGSQHKREGERESEKDSEGERRRGRERERGRDKKSPTTPGGGGGHVTPGYPGGQVPCSLPSVSVSVWSEVR